MSDKNNGDKEIESGWIRELAAILHETGLTEIEIEKADVRLRVSRAASSVVQTAAPVASAPAPVASEPAISETGAPARDLSSHPGAVPSPMVGTAYLAPSPGSEPFIKKGDQVSAGQTLMIIEAMKTMNPIAAPRGGVVAEIVVSDSQPVEFGEPLVIIE